MNMADVMAAERVKISQQWQELEDQIKALRSQQENLDEELKAIYAYEVTKRGKRKIGEVRRDNVIEAIRAVPGIRRAGICARVGARTDSQKQAISSTLTALAREGVIRREGRRAYFLN